MKTLLRRSMVRLGLVGLVTALALTLAPNAAVAAYPTNPYNAQSACGGTGWTQLATKQLTFYYYGVVRNAAKIYVMYRAGYNCVATIVQWEAGTASPVVAEIDVEGDGKGWIQDSGEFKYYAAVKAYAAGKCIRWGGAHSPEYLVQSQSEFRQEVFTFCG